MAEQQSHEKKANMLWGGRFTGGLDPLMVAYNESIYFDKNMYRQDILGSIAFARANCKAGVISQDEFSKIEVGLREVIKRVNRSPLGCGALAGNPFGIDREMMAKELGFEGLMWNSMGAVADRDFVAETLQWGAMFMQHISRWAEDLIIYSTAEFGFVRLADAYSTGSSLMPQKKNPDSLELLRGKSGRAFGHMAGFMMVQKGLPSTYNKDLQESIEPMLDHVRTVSDSIQIAEGVLATLEARGDRMRAALDPFMLATDVADYLVRKGVPFRETHHISGRCVALSEQTNTPMDKLTYEQLRQINARFEPDIAESFDYDRSVEMRTAKGGTSKETVLEQVKVLRGMLE
ncbi:hypothetical protein RB594_009006 [Gaeumannomyces avenae]